MLLGELRWIEGKDHFSSSRTTIADQIPQSFFELCDRLLGRKGRGDSRNAIRRADYEKDAQDR